MRKRQKYITAGVTIVAALVSAHLMQRSSEARPAGITGNPERSSPAQAPAPDNDAIQFASTHVPAVVKIQPTAAPSVITTDTPPPRQPVPAVTRAAAEDAGPSPALPGPPPSAQGVATLPRADVNLDDRMDRVEVAPATRATQDIEGTPANRGGVAPGSPEGADRNALGLTCGAILTASPGPAATVDLTLTAPCRGGETVTVRHGDLTFSDRLDDFGTYRAQLPAFGSDARYSVSFGDGTSTETEVGVPGATAAERVVLQWQGKAGFQLHALEFGADYGEPGHVWRGTPGDSTLAGEAGGGFLMRLGDPTLDDARVAEVYTYPDSARSRDGVVRLNIEAEVTAYNCDQDVTGQTLQRDAGGRMAPVSLTLAMPDCAAVGEYIVLKNLLQDLKIASN